MPSEESDLSRTTALPVRSLSKGQGATLALKIAITLLCFWYLFRHVDTAELRRTLPGIDIQWSMLAMALLVAQIPLVGLRWFQIAKILTMRGRQLTWVWMSVAAGIAQFFGQILPVVAGDGVRVWFLGRFSNNWRDAAIRVVIDRCVGIGLLLVFTLVILLLPSSLGAIDQDRNTVVTALAIMLVVALTCLAVSARLGPKLTG